VIRAGGRSGGSLPQTGKFSHRRQLCAFEGSPAGHVRWDGYGRRIPDFEHFVVDKNGIGQDVTQQVAGRVLFGRILDQDHNFAIHQGFIFLVSFLRQAPAGVEPEGS